MYQKTIGRCGGGCGFAEQRACCKVRSRKRMEAESKQRERESGLPRVDLIGLLIKASQFSANHGATTPHTDSNSKRQKKAPLSPPLASTRKWARSSCIRVSIESLLCTPVLCPPAQVQPNTPKLVKQYLDHFAISGFKYLYICALSLNNYLILILIQKTKKHPTNSQ